MIVQQCWCLIYTWRRRAFFYLFSNDHYTGLNLKAPTWWYPDNTFIEVGVFVYEFHAYDLPKENDFVIYKLLLDLIIWDVGMGTVTRKPEQQRPRKRTRLVIEHSPASLKASVMYKATRFWYLDHNPSSTVRVYAFPAASLGGWEASITITIVDRLST